MGQAAQRAARLKGLQPLNVGPSEFEVGLGSVIFIAKNIAEAKLRMIAAVADVMTTHTAVKDLQRLIAASSDDVGWIVVSYAPGGGVFYQQFVNSLEAMERVIGFHGESYAARKTRWSTLVFGTTSDLETVRSQVFRFQEDVELSQPAVAPVISVRQGVDPKIFLEIARSDVETMNLAPALLFFDTFLTSIEAVEKMAGSVVVSFSGYDEDTRFLGQIPAVNAFLRQLVSFAPWAPLVLDTSSFFLFVSALDVRVSIKTVDEQGILIESSPAASMTILDGFKWTMAEFLASRFFVSEVPASMRGTFLEWAAFLNSGPNAVPAPEWDI